MTCSHPGITLLQQYLEPHKISQNALARAIKVPPRRINEIIHGKRSITADTAIRLATYFGGGAAYWMHIQAQYDIEIARDKINIQLSTIQSPLNQTALALPTVTKSSIKTKNGIKNRIMR